MCFARVSGEAATPHQQPSAPAQQRPHPQPGYEPAEHSRRPSDQANARLSTEPRRVFRARSCGNMLQGGQEAQNMAPSDAPGSASESSVRHEHRHHRYGSSQHRQPGEHPQQKQTPAQPSSTRRAPGQDGASTPVPSSAGRFSRRGTVGVGSPELRALRQQPGHGRCAQQLRNLRVVGTVTVRPGSSSEHPTRAQPAAPAPERMRQRIHPGGQRGEVPSAEPCSLYTQQQGPAVQQSAGEPSRQPA